MLQRVFRMNREDVRNADHQERHNSAEMVPKEKENNSMQFAHNAERKQKSLLSRVWINRFTAANVLLTVNNF